MAGIVLEVRDLVKKLDGHVILNGLNLEVREGEVVVILGPSGCGKSTLLRCIDGLEDIQSGSISVQGREASVSGKDAGLLRQKIGMVFQSYDLFPHLTVMGNVVLAPVKVQKRAKDEARGEALELLEKVGLSDYADSYPRQLSGGQKQRVAIVRALIMHPEILLFDEVTAALDPEMVREVLDVIWGLARQGRTMLIVTHEMQFAKSVADRIVFMEDGRVVEEGAAGAFFEHPKTERARKFLNVFAFENVR